jgi:hypothetical protein
MFRCGFGLHFTLTTNFNTILYSYITYTHTHSFYCPIMFRCGFGLHFTLATNFNTILYSYITYTHARARARAHTHTHTYIYIYIYIYFFETSMYSRELSSNSPFLLSLEDHIEWLHIFIFFSVYRICGIICDDPSISGTRFYSMICGDCIGVFG